MSCCAIEDCGDPECPSCSVSRRFAIVPCEGIDGEQVCKYIEGHRPPCIFTAKPEKKEQPLRDGDPKLAAERKRDPTFTKRQRAGPNWVPADRRV